MSLCQAQWQAPRGDPMKTVTLSGLGAYGVQANSKMAFGVLPWMWCFRSLQMLEQPWSLASAPCGPPPSRPPPLHLPLRSSPVRCPGRAGRPLRAESGCRQHCLPAGVGQAGQSCVPRSAERRRAARGPRAAPAEGAGRSRRGRQWSSLPRQTQREPGRPASRDRPLSSLSVARGGELPRPVVIVWVTWAAQGRAFWKSPACSPNAWAALRPGHPSRSVGPGMGGRRGIAAGQCVAGTGVLPTPPAVACCQAVWLTAWAEARQLSP